MSKTFYANGTGTVAIFDGDDESIVNNPYLNLDKFHFHSDLDYLYYVATISGSLSYPAASWGGVFRDDVVATIPWVEGNIPITFTRINGVDVCGDYTFQKSGAYSFRMLGTRTTLEENLLKIGIYQHTLKRRQDIAPFTANYEVKLYSTENRREGEPLLITPNRTIFSQGKFDSEKKYAKLGAGFKLHTAPAYSTGSGEYWVTFSYSEPATIEVTV